MTRDVWCAECGSGLMLLSCVMLQCCWRCHVARRVVRELVGVVYMQLIDETTGYPYFYNTRTGESQWTRPLSRLMLVDMPVSSRQAAPATARVPVTSREQVMTSRRDPVMTARREQVMTARRDPVMTARCDPVMTARRDQVMTARTMSKRAAAICIQVCVHDA